MLRSWPTRPGPNGMTMNVITAVRNTTTGAQVNTRRSAPVGREVLLDEHLEPVHDRDERRRTARPGSGPTPEVHQRDDLHLHVDDDERGRDAEQEDAGHRRPRTGRSRGWRPRTSTSHGPDVARPRGPSGSAPTTSTRNSSGRMIRPASVRLPQARLTRSRPRRSLVDAAHDRVERGHDGHRVGDQVVLHQHAHQLEVDERRVVDLHPERLVGPVADHVRPVQAARAPRPPPTRARAGAGAGAGAWP